MDDTGDEQARFVRKDASFRSPLVAGDDRIYVAISRRLESEIVGVDAATGEVRWQPASLDHGSLIGHAAGRLLIDTTADKSLVAFAPASSNSMLWRHPTGKSWNGRPATSGGVLFGPVFEKRGRKHWAAYLVARELGSGKERWRLEMKNWKRKTSPSAGNGVVCVGTEDKYLHGIDAKQGKTKWVFAPPVKVKRSYVGALDCKVSGDTVLAWDDRGHLFALERETGKLRWAAVLPRGVRNPILVGDTVHTIAGDGFLYAIE